jgi:hypothetical protein
MKTMLVRLDDGQAAELQTVARVDRLPIADEIREAIAAHLEARRADPEFQKRLHLAMERDREQYLSMCVPAPLLPLSGGGAPHVVSGDDWEEEAEVSEGGPA